VEDSMLTIILNGGIYKWRRETAARRQARTKD
jgi:hypothetical protein